MNHWILHYSCCAKLCKYLYSLHQNTTRLAYFLMYQTQNLTLETNSLLASNLPVMGEIHHHLSNQGHDGSCLRKKCTSCPLEGVVLIKPVNKRLNCRASRLSPPFTKSKAEREKRERIRERKTHTRTLTLQSPVIWCCRGLVWIKFNSPSLSSFQVHGKRGSERRRWERAKDRESKRERESVLLVFISANFLIFFLCAFWRLRLDPLQMQRGTSQWRNGKVAGCKTCIPSQRGAGGRQRESARERKKQRWRRENHNRQRGWKRERERERLYISCQCIWCEGCVCMRVCVSIYAFVLFLYRMYIYVRVYNQEWLYTVLSVHLCMCVADLWAGLQLFCGAY